MNQTSTHFNCLIVGGPDHARRLQVTCSSENGFQPTMTGDDGLVCSPFAFRRSPDGRQLWLLLHPDASGAQLREQLLLTEAEFAEVRKPERRRNGLHFLAASA
ncbi:MAG: hypothetical protein WCD66_12415 [Rhodanobacteraceae bacterium]